MTEPGAAPVGFGRWVIFPADHLELVLQGVDDADRKCWRTYTGTVTVRGELVWSHFIAYSPPSDWGELSLPATGGAL